MNSRYGHESRTVTVDGARPAFGQIVDIAEVPRSAWLRLYEAAIDANPFYHPDWCVNADSQARVQGGVRVLLAWQDAGRDQLIGLLPVVSAWQAMRLPLPVLFAWQAYGPRTVPLIDRNAAPDAWRGLRAAAADMGARALSLRYFDLACEMRHLIDPTGEAAERASARLQRASLDATQDADAILITSLGAKKLKELRRQRHRLEEGGMVSLRVSREPSEIGPALESFMLLEAKGWKGARGSAMARHAGDAAFIRAAAPAMAANGHLEVLTMMRGEDALASTIVLRQGRFASWFKIGIDPDVAKFSPGMQLALELTRHYCADPKVEIVDSNADGERSMADHVWGGHMTVADLLVPVRTADPLLPPLRHLLAVREIARNQVRSLRDLVRPAKA